MGGKLITVRELEKFIERFSWRNEREEAIWAA
jgi:hypothetical protein